MEGLVLFGSCGQKTHDIYSDIDLIIYLNDSYKDPKNDEIVRNKIIELLSNLVGNILINFNIYDKWVIYTNKNFIKLEIQIKNISRAKEDIIFISESRLNSPEEAIVFDRNGKISQVYRSNWIQLNDPKHLRKEFLDGIYKFIYYYDGFMTQIARDDEYKAYMNYTIAFYKLISLKAMVEGEYYNLSQPKNFTTNILKDWNLRKKFYKLSAGLRKYEMFEQMDNLISMFFSVLENGKKNFNINIDLMRFQIFFTNIKEKYPSFKNFRDISLIPNIFSNNVKITKGLIFRSASLSKYDSDIVLKFLKDKEVSHILDLRGKKELKEYKKYNNKYIDRKLKKFVVNIPFEPIVEIYIPNKPAENFYYAVLKDFRKKIKKIFKKYLTNVLDERLIIHCEGGKDRTGIIIAILMDLLGLERKLIINDYLLSYSNTKREYIEFLFDTLDNEYGNSLSFLTDYCRIPINTIKNIKTIMVED